MAPRKYSIEDMRSWARSHGGQCLSAEYKNPHTKLLWQCTRGHSWPAIPCNVRQGSWCAICRRTAKLSLEKMHAHARSKGGKCLSDVYVNVRTPLEWECAEGHRWPGDADHVINRGRWCPTCGKYRYTLSDMQAIARERGGECLSDSYQNCLQTLTWKCAVGHVWPAQGMNIVAGTWCPKCARRSKLCIEEMRAIARTKGGRCRSARYVHNHHKLQWQCSKGHRWRAEPSSVKSGTWCPICKKGIPPSIRQARKHAALHGGKCLSRAVVNSRTVLEWECRRGHRWPATYTSVRFGSWCPLCIESAGESICRNIFERIFQKSFPRTRRLSWLTSSLGRRLELDGYCAELKIAFEYNGNQHYDPNHIYSQGKDFERRRACDEEKRLLCELHGVRLVHITEFPRLRERDDCERFVRCALERAGLLSDNSVRGE